MKDWTIVDVLKHSRHDWLNKLQLIKGNLSLNRIERAKEIIEEIVIEAQNEAKLTNLQANGLAALLLTYNWEGNHFLLEFEILNHSFNLSELDTKMVDWCQQFFKILNNTVSKNRENNLILSIDPNEGEVRFFFDFSGIIEDMKTLEDWFQSYAWNQSVTLNTWNISETELTVEILVK